MKKVLSLVLALTMILSCFTVAFAAPTDVTDKNQVKAVDALMSLGIVNGYTDGSYKPENTVTRAEMAKLLVTALGHGDLAQGSESSFKDAKGKWYDGFVAMAAGLELVTGYPDGTFKGDNPVSYQEAIVMTLRALGYTNSAVNNGVNAYNASKYKALGATVGLLDNVTYKNSGANRGDIAVIVYNALETETVDINDKGLAEKIVVDKTLVQVPGSNPAVYKEKPVYEVLLDRVAEREDVAVTINSLNPKHKDYLGNLVELAPYMYQTITAYLNKDGEVMFVKGSKTTTVVGSVTPIRFSDIQWNDAANRTKVYVTKEDKSVEKVQFPVAPATTSIPVFLNGGEITATIGDFLRDSTNLTENPLGENGGKLWGSDITFCLNSDGVATHAVARLQTQAIQMTKTYKTGSSMLGTIALPKDASGKVDLSKVTIKGAVESIEDIAIDDVVAAYTAKGIKSTPDKIELVVTRETVEGRITATNGTGFVINGETYFTNGASIAVNDEGTFFLDENGDVVAFQGKSMSNADYALITSLKQGVPVGTDLIKEAEIKLLNKDGKVVTYKFDEDAQYVLTNTAGTKSTGNIFAGTDRSLQAFNTGVAGFRANNYIVTGYDLSSSDAITKISIKELDQKTINASSKTFVAANDVVIFSAYASTTNGTVDTFKTATVNDLVQASRPGYYGIINDKGEYTLIVANEQLFDNSNYAIITAVNTIVDDNNQTVKKVTAYVNGEKVDYLTAKSGYSVPAAADYRAKLFALPLANGKISASITATDAITDARLYTTTSSAISTVNATRNTFTLKVGNINQSKALADNAIVYVYEVNSSTNLETFVRVGDISDLELENAHFDFYNLNPATDATAELYEVVIVRVQR